MVKSVRAFFSHAEGLQVESRKGQPVVKTVCYNSTANACQKWCECHGSTDMIITNGCPVLHVCGTLKKLDCLYGQSMGQNLQLFTGNDDVTILVKSVECDGKPKQINLGIEKLA